MIEITVEKAAQMFAVSQKTVRAWINEGMPVIKEGRKGTGTGALIDQLRALDWVRRKKGAPAPAISDLLAANPFPGSANPLRGLLQLYSDDMPLMINAAVMGWYRERKDINHGATDWQAAGLTDEQARRVAWDLFLWVLTLVTSYRSTFEKHRLEPITGGADLDQLASFWFCGDIRSEWNNNPIEIPSEILELAPAEARAAFESLKAPTDDSAKEKTS